MIAVDTNILARFYCDDPEDPEAARQRPIARRIVLESPALHVPLTVVLELEWVLRSSYECEKDDVTDVLASLLSAADLAFESEHALEVALQLYREGTADFADCVHVALAAQAGEQPLWTFDRRAARIQGARLLTAD